MTELRIGAFLGLLDQGGTVRFQERTEHGSSLLPGRSFTGTYELPGGRSKLAIEQILTKEGLLGEASREGREELGVRVMYPANSEITVYRAVARFSGDIVDWAFMIPIPWGYWRMEEEKRQTISLNPDELRALAEQDKILSGWGKRMCRMGLAALLSSPVDAFATKAVDMLAEVEPDWQKCYFSPKGGEALLSMQEEARALIAS